MTTVNKWRIFCTTETSWTYGWLTAGDPAPTTCFTDHTHTVNLNSVNIVDTVSPNSVTINEETVKTQGNFRGEGFSFNIPANTISNYLIDFTYPINLLAVWINVKLENLGDVLNASYEPSYNGSLTADLTGPQTVISLDYVSIMIVNIGFICILKRQSDGHTEILGEVKEIDKVNNTITVENPTTENFIIGDIFILRVNGVKNIPLECVGRQPLGGSKVGASYLPDTGKLVVNYENKSMVDAKKFSYELEYLY